METFLWVEKHRPNTIKDCVLPEHLKNTFREFVEDKHIPNLILSGGAGIGKTTVAKAMINEIGATFLFINGSEESGIDVLRNKIKNFASTVSLEGGRKYVILDEADYLNPQSTQPALRGFMEEFHKNCGFVLTCNYKNRLIEPLHSRCSVIDFIIPKDDKPKLAKDFFSRVKNILELENIKYEPRVVMEVLTKYFPDWRRTLNELQRYSTSGQIDAGILVNISEQKNLQMSESGLSIILTMTLCGFIVGFMIIFTIMLIVVLYLMQFLSWLSTNINQLLWPTKK